MSRPLFNHSYQELELLFNNDGDSIQTLNILRSELKHRSTGKSKKLLDVVEQKLDGQVTISAHPAKQASPAQSNDDHEINIMFEAEVPTSGALARRKRKGASPLRVHSIAEKNALNLSIPDDLEIPRVFTRMRPPGTAGLPDPYERERSQELNLGLPVTADVADKYIAALGALIIEIKRTGSGQKRYELENGVRIEAPHGEALYSFTFTDEADLFEDAAVSVEIHGQKVDGSIVSIGAGKLLLAISGDHGPLVERAMLLIDATALLDALKNKIEQAKNKEVTINRSLADAVVDHTKKPPPNPLSIPPSGDLKELNLNQQKACKHALSASITHIWGPPGTGKTKTIGLIVRSAFEADKRVLICSNTNKAVDQVLLSVCKNLGKKHPALEKGRVVRVGRITDEKLKKDFTDYITVDGITKRLSQELDRRKRELEDAIRKIDSNVAKARHVLDLFSNYEAAKSNVRNLQEQVKTAKQQMQELKSETSQIATRIADLECELLKRRGAFFTLFKRSEETIVRDAEQTKAAKEKQIRLVDEARISIETTNQALAAAQLHQEQCHTAIKGHNQNIAQREVNEANKLRDPHVQELRKIDVEITELRSSIMREAKILGATCTKTFLSAKDFGQFDIVIIDEASMVIPPMVWFSAGLSRERVVVCGDSKQIPPIVPTNEEAIYEVLGRDVLEDCEKDPETIMLNIQHRMDSKICDLISRPMYDGKLTTSNSREKPPKTPPAPLDNILTIIDTSELWPFESVTAFHSRFNLMHALLCRNLAWHLNRSGWIKESKQLGISTPYTAQAKLIQKLLEGDGEDLKDQIQAGTVHRYQGDECCMMVLDIPESHGGAWNIGQFVQGVPPKQVGARLLNVAVSRAKCHLVVIANLTYLDKHLPSSSLLRSILYDMQENGSVVPGRTLLELRPIEGDLKGLLGHIELDPQAESFGVFDEKSFDPAAKADFLSAKESIVIFSGFVTPRRVSEYGDLFRSKIAEGVKVRCITRPPHLNGSMSPAQGKEALDALEGIGCVVDCRARIHQKVVLIDNEIVWHGSLNALSNAHTTEESMTRLVNAGFARALSASLAKRRYPVEKAASVIAQPENPRCELCKSRTVYAEGRYGPYFYCENRQAENGCDWSINMTAAERKEKYPTSSSDGRNAEPRSGPPCPKCGGSTILRSSTWGKFYGCERYPKCKGVVKKDRQKRIKTTRSKRK